MAQTAGVYIIIQTRERARYFFIFKFRRTAASNTACVGARIRYGNLID